MEPARYIGQQCTFCGERWIGAHSCVSENAEPPAAVIADLDKHDLYTVGSMLKELDRLRAEVKELVAYRDRTEAALKQCSDCADPYEPVATALLRHGLWREPKEPTP
jgi:hypothetical protein